MAIEILDSGACRAAGRVTLGSPIQLSALGVSAALGLGPGQVQLTLTEPIAQSELIALVSGGIAFWANPVTIFLQADAGAQTIDFQLYGLTELPAASASGNANPIAPVTPPFVAVKGYALIAADGTVTFDTGVVGSVAHTGGTNVYTITLQAAVQDPNVGGVAMATDLGPGSIAGQSAAAGTEFVVETFNAAGSSAERPFVLFIATPT
jgi:hypothetical protein